MCNEHIFCGLAPEYGLTRNEMIHLSSDYTVASRAARDIPQGYIMLDAATSFEHM